MEGPKATTSFWGGGNDQPLVVLLITPQSGDLRISSVRGTMEPTGIQPSSGELFLIAVLHGNRVHYRPVE